MKISQGEVDSIRTLFSEGREAAIKSGLQLSGHAYDVGRSPTQIHCADSNHDICRQSVGNLEILIKIPRVLISVSAQATSGTKARLGLPCSLLTLLVDFHTVMSSSLPVDSEVTLHDSFRSSGIMQVHRYDLPLICGRTPSSDSQESEGFAAYQVPTGQEGLAEFVFISFRYASATLKHKFCHFTHETACMSSFSAYVCWSCAAFQHVLDKCQICQVHGFLDQEAVTKL